MICQLLHTLNVGGAEILATSLVRNMPEFRFVFFCLDAAGVRANDLRDAGAVVEVVGRGPGFDAGCAARIRELWRKHDVRLVHVHQYTPFFYALAARGLRSGPPIIFTEHGRFFPDLPSWKHTVFNRLLLRRGDRVTAVGRSVADAVVRNEGIPARRVQVIYNGIDVGRFYPGRLSEARRHALRSTLGLGRERVILMTARLDPIKDHPTALRALATLLRRLPDTPVVLLLAGDGPESERLHESAHTLGLGAHVRFLGERSDVADLLQIADVFLLTSVSEGIPLTVLEAGASGVPVVATEVGGLPEILLPGKTGLMAPCADSERLAECLATLLMDPTHAQNIAHAARERVLSHFALDDMLARYAALYRGDGQPAREMPTP